jgi:hypothetical protein
MTTRVPQQETSELAPGAMVYDVIAQAIGSVADPDAYPVEHLGAACALVVPVRGSGPAWQAVPGALRLATPDEIEAAL